MIAASNSHAFDRLLAVKLEQVYEILVPERPRHRRRPAREGKSDEDAAIYARSPPSSRRRRTDRQPDGGAARVRTEQGYASPMSGSSRTRFSGAACCGRSGAAARSRRRATFRLS